MVKNYSLHDAFKSLEELDDKIIETSIIINGPLNENFSNSTSDNAAKGNVRVFNAKWDANDTFNDLPDEVFLELSDNELLDENIKKIIREKLGDEFGYLIESYDYEKISPKDASSSDSTKLTEETFSLNTDDGLKDIKEFEKEEDKEQPELTVVDTDANTIDEVASNTDAAGSFVFTCDRCGENIFRTLDDLKAVGYERIDDTLFKLKNKDVTKGEFYHCAKCGNDTFTGNKQIVLADVDSEVEGKPEEKVNSVEDVSAVEEPAKEDNLPEINNSDIVVEESLEKNITEEKEWLSDKIAKVLDDYGILYGDIVEYPEHRRCNIVGIDPEEWQEAEEAIKNELNLNVIVPPADHEEFDDELEVFEESLSAVLSPENIAEFRKHEFFKDFTESTVRKFISLYLEFIGEAGRKSDYKPTVEEVYNFITEEGLGLFALDNFNALNFYTFKKLGEQDPKFVKACKKYYPDAFYDDKWVEAIFKDIRKEDVENTLADVKKIYLSLDESLEEDIEIRPGSTTIVQKYKEFDSKQEAENFIISKEGYGEMNIRYIPKTKKYRVVWEEIDESLKEGFKKVINGKTFWSKDGEEWEECTQEEFDECGYKDITKQDEFDDVTITDIDEKSIDEAICNKLSSMYENFASYKTETAFLKDVENKIILEGKLTFTSNKEQQVKFILEAIESENNNIRFKLICEDFSDIDFEIKTKLTEGLLEASSAEKRAVLNGGKDLDDLIQGKAIARIKDPKARAAAVAAAKAGRPDAVKDFTGDRKEDQAAANYEKKALAMQKAGLTESDDDWKNPEDCSTLEEYDNFGLSDLEYNIKNNHILDAEEIEESDEADWDQDADGYVAHVCSIAAWGAPTSNEAEKRLLVDYIARNYPTKLKLIRRYLGNEYSSVELDPEVILETTNN